MVIDGIFYCRDNAVFSVSASNKLSCTLSGQCFEIGNKNIPPNRQRLLEERYQRIGNIKYAIFVRKIQMNNIEQNKQIDFYNKVTSLLKEARESVVRSVNKQWFIPIWKQVE